jgi:aldehyde dehydrogenase (NAD+)
MTAPTAHLPTTDELRERARVALRACGVDPSSLGSGATSRTPITGEPLLDIGWSRTEDVDHAVDRARTAFDQWRMTPAPVRGALVKRFGQLLADHKSDIAELITLEVGKVRSEALGEVQEMIDICDFAVGLSRQLYGRTMPSERPGHRLSEQWLPLGVVGVISAFNFPAAVWSWNAALAITCGDPVVWKPSELASLTALACTAVFDQAATECGAPPHLNQVILGDSSVAERLVAHPAVPLISATGSTRMGRAVAPIVAARFGRSILELGGNNAAVVTPSADLELAVRGIVFAATGTAGQRCTSMRRVIAHEDIADELMERLTSVYQRLPIGSPFDEGTLIGPLHTERAHLAMQSALTQAAEDGGKVLVGGERQLADSAAEAYYVQPALVAMPAQTDVVRAETFAPVLYVLTYRDFEEAIALHNAVPQGLSSSIFTQDQREAERFLAANGSDCGIVNVNIGTSGAEIGGAFGGDKESGGGRESGSDAWRAYMRRVTNTINYSDSLPLAQGVDFSV